MEERIKEFHWNLKRLIREGYPDGIPLHNLNSVYGHWIKQPVEPRFIIPNSDYWEDVFLTNSLRNTFVVVRRDQVPYVRIRPGPETSIDELTVVLELASYANYRLLAQTRNNAEQIDFDVERQQHSPDSTSRSNAAGVGAGESSSNARHDVAVLPPPAANQDIAQPRVEIPAIKPEISDNKSTGVAGNPATATHAAFSDPANSTENQSLMPPTAAVGTNTEEVLPSQGPIGTGTPMVKIKSEFPLVDLSLDDGGAGAEEDDNTATNNQSSLNCVTTEDVPQAQPVTTANSNSNDSEQFDEIAPIVNPHIPVDGPDVAIVIKTEEVDTSENGQDENPPDPLFPAAFESITVKYENPGYGLANVDGEDGDESELENPIVEPEPINLCKMEKESIDACDLDPELPLSEPKSPVDLASSVSTQELQQASGPEGAENSEEPLPGPSRRTSGRARIQIKPFQIPSRSKRSKPDVPASASGSPKKPAKRVRRDSQAPASPLPTTPGFTPLDENDTVAVVTNTPAPSASSASIVEPPRPRSKYMPSSGLLMSEEDLEAALTALVGPSMSDEQFTVIADCIANNIPPIERRLFKWVLDVDLLDPIEWIAVPVSMPERPDNLDKSPHRRTIFKSGPVTTFLFIEEGWMPTGDDFQLPKNTIVYGEFVEQLHSGRFTFDVIDCAIILGRDVRHLCFQERRNAVSIFTSSVLNNESHPLKMKIRMKNVYHMTEMAHKIFDRFSNFYQIETKEEIRCLPDPEKRDHNAVGGIVFMRTWFGSDPTDFTFAMDGRFFWWFDSELALSKKDMLYNDNSDTLSLYHFLERIKRSNTMHREG